MKFHELKTDPEPFAAQLRGDKNYEVRINDRNFKLGDCLVLRETAESAYVMQRTGSELVYTGRVLSRTITDVREFPALKDGYVILGTRPI